MKESKIEININFHSLGGEQQQQKSQWLFEILTVNFSKLLGWQNDEYPESQRLNGEPTNKQQLSDKQLE
mgnify:CR=1 FL=1